ncbi:MAG: prepilin-type N-terminal cleavage/methylation domain-containing protein [Candidatus Ozemobacteraceae bacterium]
MTSRDVRGVTLIEVLLALTLTALVAGFIYSELTWLTRRLGRERYWQTARALAWKKLVEIESMPLANGTSEGKFGGQFPQYTYRMVVGPGYVNGNGVRGLFSVHLRIDWQDDYTGDYLETETLMAIYPES